jgi:hypothetical protein
VAAPPDPNLPRPPDKPDPSDCCNSGCSPCILDLYDDALERWEARIRALGHDPAEVLAGRLSGMTPGA